MPELPIGKRLNVLRLYFQGLAYDEIAHTATVAKGTVTNVVDRGGR